MFQEPDNIQKIIDETREKKLETLDISYDTIGNSLSVLPDEIRTFVWVTDLNIGGHRLTKLPDWMSNFTQLIHLNLENTLFDLENTALNHNKPITLPDWMRNFTQLMTLNLRNSYLATLPDWMSNFTQLTTLGLSGIKLTTVPDWIGNFTQLTYLDLSNNDLTSFPNWVGNFTQLTTLDLSGNKLTTLPNWVRNFPQLTTLNLSNNYLIALPNWMRNFTQLTTLNLRNNDFTSLPNWMGNFTQLTTLDLRNNYLTSHPNWIKDFMQLTYLDLSGTNLTSHPDWIRNFTQLTYLDLSDNKLTTLPDWMRNLTQLTYLNLSDNKLTTLPDWMRELNHLNTLLVNGNKIAFPPKEIIGDGKLRDLKLERLRNFYQQIQTQGVDYLYEAKLLIVGEPRAGKTTLANKIEDPTYQLPPSTAKDTTQGIDIKQWSFPHQDRTFQVNIWDFGGQEIYHATHQFFLTARSLYILLIDARKEDVDFNFWLNVIALLSDNSPLLIVVNEKEDVSRQLSKSQLRSHYENLMDIISCNLADNRGLASILQAIEYHMPRLSHVGAELPKMWISIRETLEKDPRDFISLDEFQRICNEHNLIKLEDQLGLLQYLHDLGVCLHFHKDFILSKTVILKPHWGTQGVYRVLDNETVKAQWGQFTQGDLQDLWADQRYAHMQVELLQLMINFQLCYELPLNKGSYIAPQLLPPDVPDYEWDHIDNLRLKYKYGFMPKGIITRLIVAVHRLIEGDLVWRTGVVISDQYAWAMIKEDSRQEEIEINISGRNKQRLLHNIMYTFDEIHSTFPDLKYNELIPCNCSRCNSNSTTEFYTYKFLERAVFKDQEVQCRESFEQCDPSNLISDYKRLEYDEHDLFSHPQEPPLIVVNLNQFQETSMDKKIDQSTQFHGDVSNANINIHSKLENVKMTVSNLPHINDDSKSQLKEQIDVLESELETLKKAYVDKETEVNLILKRVGELVEEANTSGVDKEDVEDTGNKLLRAAKKVQEIAPIVVGTATTIVKLLLTGF